LLVCSKAKFQHIASHIVSAAAHPLCIQSTQTRSSVPSITLRAAARPKEELQGQSRTPRSSGQNTACLTRFANRSSPGASQFFSGIVPICPLSPSHTAISRACNLNFGVIQAVTIVVDQVILGEISYTWMSILRFRIGPSFGKFERDWIDCHSNGNVTTLPSTIEPIWPAFPDGLCCVGSDTLKAHYALRTMELTLDYDDLERIIADSDFGPGKPYDSSQKLPPNFLP
jgi:hypothetical protein